MEEQILTNFEKEYSREIRAGEITPDDFSALGIPEDAIKAEIYLRTVYGDDYFDEDEEDVFDEKAKSVEKIGETDLSYNKTLKSQMEKIETDEFNDTLESLLMRVGR